MTARLSRCWRPAGAALLGMLAVALIAAPSPAAAATPTCSLVLFVPSDNTGAYVVEQPESAPGAIFCQPSLGSLEFGVDEAPGHGTLGSLEPNGLGGANFTYTPAPGFTGADSFALSAREGDGDPVLVRLDVSVRPASDDAPICSAQLDADSEGDTYRVENGAAATGSIDCFDDEGADLSFTVENGPDHGTLGEIEPVAADAASFTYTPSPGYEGGDTFSFVANDGSQDSTPAVVAVTVTAVVDDPPRCTATLATTSDANGTFEIEQGETAHGAVTCVDNGSAALDFSPAVQPAHGALALSASVDGSADLAYTPVPGYLGFDSFRVDVSDGTNPPTQVSVRVRAVAARNDAPTCTAELVAPTVDNAYRIKQGATVAGLLSCEDDEGDPLSFAIAAPPQHGSATVVGEDGHFSYTAPTSYTGQDELVLRANDGANDSQPVTLEIDVVAPANEPPACQIALGVGANADGAYLVERNTAVPGRIVCSDDGEDALGLTIAAPPLHGSLSALDPEGPTSAGFTYAPAPGYAGPDAFTLAGDDGVNDPQAATAAVEVVEPGPDVPDCRARLNTKDVAGTYEVESGETVSGMLTCFDAGGSALSFSVSRDPGHGAIAGLEPVATGVARFTYTADGDWTGADDFGLVAGNGQHSSNVVDVDVAVVPPVDDPPECTISLFSEKLGSGAYPAESGEANPGVVACVDDEGEPLTFAVAEGPQHGALTGLHGQGQSAFFDYTPDSDHLGPDALSVSVSDPAHGVDVVGLDIEVKPAANTAPACAATLNAPIAAGSYRVAAGASATGQISCEDAENDPLAFSVAESPSHGSLSGLSGSGDSRSFTYTASGQSGPDQFSLEANDGQASSPVAVVSLLIEPSSESPPAGSSPTTPTSTPSPVASPGAPSPPAKAKAKKCRRGFKKKKLHGKVVCVKKTKKHKAKKHKAT